MRKLLIPFAAALGAAAMAAAAWAQAPAAPLAFTQIRGTVQSLDGVKLVVLQKDGPVAVTLADNWTVTLLKNVDVNSIQAGSFVGTTEVEKPDGTGVSQEVHVFPPGVKAGAGHYPWGSGGAAMMTNGDVTGVVKGAAGPQLDIEYPGGKRHVVVPPGTPVVLFTTGDRAAIKPGLAVFVLAIKAADGGYGAGGVSIGENGKAPPM